MIFIIIAAVLRKFLVSMGRRSLKWMQRKTWDGMPSILELEWTIIGQSLRYASEHALFVSLVTPSLQPPPLPHPMTTPPLSSFLLLLLLLCTLSFLQYFYLISTSILYSTLLFSSLSLSKISLLMNYITCTSGIKNTAMSLYNFTYSTFVSNF